MPQSSSSHSLTLDGSLTVNRLGFGAMRICGPGVWGPPADKPACLATLRRAVELGVNFIDTADSYGPDVSEELIAEALYPYPKDLVIATKVGWTRYAAGVWQHDASPKHIAEAIEGSLRRLRRDSIDLYQLHTPDPAVSFDASMEAIVRLKEQGKVRHIGLSNVTLEHIRRAEQYTPIASIQNRYSFSDREWDFVLDDCASKGRAFIPWGPMAQQRKAAEVVEQIAHARDTSTGVVSLAWLLRRSPVTLLIPGTGKVAHLEQNVSAASFQLTNAEFAQLNAVVPKPFWLRG
jgi:pyridoxine 4-dehydrogenase